MKIRHNTTAGFALRENSKTVRAMGKNLEKLSSGLRINRAGDDAAGLSISENMRRNITEANRCQSNVLEGIDLTRTADGALAEVNDMLCRAKALCLEAENGTYSELERASISEELTALFDEIDHITASSRHNTIPLFRGGGNELTIEDSQSKLIAGMELAGSQSRDAANAGISGVRSERIMRTESPDDGAWGEIDFIKDEYFDPAAPPAQAASVTFRLDSGIDVKDVNSLAGRSIQIGDNVYYFTEDSNHTYTPYTTVENKYINIISLRNYPTFDSAMQEFVTRCNDISGYTLNEADGTLTLTASIDDLAEAVEADGRDDNYYFVAQGDGEKKNGLVVKTPAHTAGLRSLGQVDGSGADNNTPKHIAKSRMNFDLGKISGSLSAQDIENLERNTVYMNLGDTQITLDLKGLFQENMTKEEVGKILAQQFVDAVKSNAATKADYTCDASYNPATGKVDIGIESPTGKSVSASFSEYSPPREEVVEDNWTAKALNMQITSTSGSVEQGYTMDIKPQYGNVKEPFAFFVGAGSARQNFLVYDSTTHPYVKSGFSDSSTNPYIQPGNRIDVAGKTEEEIKELVAEKIVAYAEKLSYVRSATVNADKTVTLSVIVGGSEKPTAGGLEVKVTSRKPASPGTSTGIGTVFGDQAAYSTQEISVSFSLGSNIKDLAGRGFYVDGYAEYWGGNYPARGRIEFVDGAGSGLNAHYQDVDISGCHTFEDVRGKIETVLNTNLSSGSPGYTVTLDNASGSNVITISTEASTDHYLFVTDGEMGLIDGGTATFSGGTKVGYSQKALDFSSISADNLDTLEGKGFRIHCATCEGEYINVFFCQTKDDPLPPEFGIPSTKVHNVLVELSKITDGDKIVKEIVDQIAPQLNHYTEVLVGDSPSILIARDKRRGDYTVDGVVYRGRISTGVKAAEPEKPPVVDPPKEDPPKEDPPEEKPPEEEPNPPVQEEAGWDIRIFASPHLEDPYIHIHLPYIDLEWLGLDPPRVVDLNEQDPLGLMEKIDQADLTISSVRGTIGAEHNRLEHAWQDLNQTEIQLTDAESRIRDADMANMMMENVKLQILEQSQQSIIAQANGRAEQVLRLLR